MRLLAFSDIHGDEVALEKLEAIAKDYDHTLICGDISRTNIFAEQIINAFPKGFVIPGNWDNEYVNRMMSKSKQYIHERRVEIGDGFNIVGFGYSSPTPFFTHGELKEEEIEKRMTKLPIDSNTILMLHCPPYGHFDQRENNMHAGSRSILKIINEKRPIAAMFGHVHEHKGIEKFGPTTLIKLPAATNMGAAAITINGRDITTEFLKL